ncbi:TetR/AcrR family transcriptional regulator [Paenibacillus gorillae]|uniref:TetR/AcrR family transcriptional regulator n=1 Tax=Paenibacillus gorillae TaxID=1243662 RepID=UPI0004B4B503|nr:TetR/AcrR family transcriptional regulator [Paenibacillus gorillae]
MSPRNVEKDQLLRETRREHILDCALQVIAKQGIDSASVKDIAKEAGLSVGNVYNYFESKDAIFSAVLQRGQINYGRKISEHALLKLDARDKLYEICENWIATPENWAFTIMLQSIRTNETVNPELREAATRRFTANLEPMADIMRQGQEAGVLIEGDPKQLAFYFVSLIQGLTLQLAPGYEIPVGIHTASIVRLFSLPDSSGKK